MKQIVFIMTHLGSKWENLMDFLKQYPRIDEPPRCEYIIRHPDHLSQITRCPHKSKNASSIWIVPILHNHQFACPILLKYHKFVFFTASLENSLEEIQKQYTEEAARSYYSYRLNRMRKYWKQVPGAPWVEKIDDTIMPYFS
jgi:hypothetical protein